MTDGTTETADERAIRLRAAERAHEAHAGAVAAAFAPLVAMGTDVLRAAAFVNGGAAVATLGFVSATLRDRPAMAAALVWPLSLFGFGFAVAAFAIGWSYFAQASHAEALTARLPAWHAPFVVDTPVSHAAAERAERFRRLALGAVFVAMASAVAGFALAGLVMIVMIR